jgi:hypothetical protein
MQVPYFKVNAKCGDNVRLSRRLTSQITQQILMETDTGKGIIAPGTYQAQRQKALWGSGCTAPHSWPELFRLKLEEYKLEVLTLNFHFGPIGPLYPLLYNMKMKIKPKFQYPPPKWRIV